MKQTIIDGQHCTLIRPAKWPAKLRKKETRHLIPRHIFPTDHTFPKKILKTWLLARKNKKPSWVKYNNVQAQQQGLWAVRPGHPMGYNHHKPWAKMRGPIPGDLGKFCCFHTVPTYAKNYIDCHPCLYLMCILTYLYIFLMKAFLFLSYLLQVML